MCLERKVEFVTKQVTVLTDVNCFAVDVAIRHYFEKEWTSATASLFGVAGFNVKNVRTKGMSIFVIKWETTEKNAFL